MNRNRNPQQTATGLRALFTDPERVVCAVLSRPALPAEKREHWCRVLTLLGSQEQGAQAP